MMISPLQWMRSFSGPDRGRLIASLRGLSFEAFFWLSIFVYSGLMLLAAPFSRRLLLALGRQWGSVALWGLASLCGIRYRVSGRGRLRGTGGQIVLSNHQSTWETIALGLIVPPPQCWVLKRELMWIPFFGWALRLFDPIAIDRKAGRDAMRQIIRSGSARLAEGYNVVIFPEGTRVPPEHQRPFAPGGAILAAKTGAAVIPVAHNAGRFWPKRGIAKYPGTIDLVIGPAIESSGLSAEAINQRAEAWIRTTLRGLP
jgi:1-acyl-sn-glycerol-3-phosphate acyltransferase